MTVTSNQFGPLIGPWDVEQAVIAAIQAWLDTFLNEIERDHGITPRTLPRPPAPASVYGGPDWLNVTQENIPAVIVKVLPSGPPEKSASSGYGQWYEVEVGSHIVDGDATVLEEHQVRMWAGFYATAVAALLIKEPIADFVIDVDLTASPSVELPEAEIRRYARGLCTVRIMVKPTLQEGPGPLEPDPAPVPDGPDPTTPGDWPTVGPQGAEITVTAEPLDS